MSDWAFWEVTSWIIQLPLLWRGSMWDRQFLVLVEKMARLSGPLRRAVSLLGPCASIAV